MVVAARAAERDAEPGSGRGFNTIDNIFVLIFLWDRAAFEVDHVVAIEAGSD